MGGQAELSSLPISFFIHSQLQYAFETSYAVGQ